MLYEIKRISLWPLIKVSFFLNLILGFIMGLLYIPFLAVMMGAMANMPSAYSSGFDMSDFPIGAMMIIMPITMSIGAAVFNTILVVIAGVFYNLVSRVMGGFEFDLNALNLTPSAPPPPQSQSMPELPISPTAPPPQPPQPQQQSVPPPPPQSSPPPPPPPSTPPSAPPPPDIQRRDDNQSGQSGPEEFRP